MLVSFSITITSYVGMVKLRGVIVIIINLKLLGYQKKPVFKLGFLSIYEQWRIRNLSWFAGLFIYTNIASIMQGVLSNLIDICVLVNDCYFQLFCGFIKSFSYLFFLSLLVQIKLSQLSTMLLNHIFILLVDWL